MPSVVAILPARWGSTRFPGKPLHLICGKPLIQHVWDRCQKSKSIDQVIVATDDIRIAETAFEFGAEVAVTSPKHRSGTDRIAEVARNLPKATHILNVQGDEPLVSPRLIDQLAQSLIREKLEMITAANPFAPDEDPQNPNAVKVTIDRNGQALYFSRSLIPFWRDKPAEISLAKSRPAKPPYYRHQGIYGYSRKFLLQFVKYKPSMLETTEQLEQLRALENGHRIKVILTKHAAVGVDTPADVAQIEAALKRP